VKIYLAHNFEAGPWLVANVAPLLMAAGHVVTSSWISNAPPYGSAEADAVKDLKDLTEADAILFFGDNFGPKPGRGKYVEFGFALRCGKKIVVLSDDKDIRQRCIFYNLPNVVIAKTVAEVLSILPKVSVGLTYQKEA
jgi:nucleoside 2-deoxyribosyltransferase